MDLTVKSRFWLESGNTKFLGSGRVELLEKIDTLGSINKAAAEMKMAYRKAWGLIKAMNEISTKPLVVKKAGGKDGGGTYVTAEGKRAIYTYRKFESELNLFLQTTGSKLKL